MAFLFGLLEHRDPLYTVKPFSHNYVVVELQKNLYIPQLIKYNFA